MKWHYKIPEPEPEQELVIGQVSFLPFIHLQLLLLAALISCSKLVCFESGSLCAERNQVC